MARLSWTTLIPILAAGCITVPRVDSPPAASRAAAPLGVAGSIRADSMDRRFFEANEAAILARVLASQRDGSLDILALSGGGAQGAFGAGVIVGLTQSGERPQFEIVTGVSTGR
jgi:predicted acylesterase/phospholipase RssA